MLLRCAASPAGDTNWVVLRVPRLEEGCHRVEAQRGSFVSAPHSFLVLDDPAAVEELRQLEQAGSGVPDAAELLHRLGAVLRFRRSSRSDSGPSSSGSRGAVQAVTRRVDAAAQVRCASDLRPALCKHLLGMAGRRATLQLLNDTVSLLCSTAVCLASAGAGSHLHPARLGRCPAPRAAPGGHCMHCSGRGGGHRAAPLRHPSAARSRQVAG